MESNSLILVVGATGYVGSRLVPHLLQAGYKVRACGRSLAKLKCKTWSQHRNVELVEADILKGDSMQAALRGCSVAYYLIHSMNGDSWDFAKKDQLAAKKMVESAKDSGLQQIIYLGGLGEKKKRLSKHLKSRAEVASILQSGSIPVTVLRAAMIIGSGSVSFEILRYLVDRLPLMLTPRWIETKNQPIAIQNVLAYLVGCAGNEKTYGETFDIGGSEILTYKELMIAYAKEADLPPPQIIEIPVSSQISSLWLQVLTPVPGYLSGPLAEGMRNTVVCEDYRIKDLIPQELLDCKTAIQLSLEKKQHYDIESRWSDEEMIRHPEWVDHDQPEWAGGKVYSDSRRMVMQGTPEDIWNPLVRIGGDAGWYFGDWMWDLRGAMDQLVGGIGMRKGRRHQSELIVGDAVDCWRVLLIEPEKRLVLLAEMTLPGEALLEFRINKLDEQRTEILQISRFLPTGLAGVGYWNAITPLHKVVFEGMLKGIAEASGCLTLEGPSETKTPAAELSTAKG